MSRTFDFIVVRGGSARAVIAARLSKDPACRVALLEAGERPPEVELIPVLCGSMQLNPATDWMYTADPGKGGLGLKRRRVPVPRGKMLGGSSGLNYMAYVRGHPGDFDSWAKNGAAGWSYADVLPYFSYNYQVRSYSPGKSFWRKHWRSHLLSAQTVPQCVDGDHHHVQRPQYGATLALDLLLRKVRRSALFSARVPTGVRRLFMLCGCRKAT